MNNNQTKIKKIFGILAILFFFVEGIVYFAIASDYDSERYSNSYMTFFCGMGSCLFISFMLIYIVLKKYITFQSAFFLLLSLLTLTEYRLYLHVRELNAPLRHYISKGYTQSLSYFLGFLPAITLFSVFIVTLLITLSSERLIKINRIIWWIPILLSLLTTVYKLVKNYKYLNEMFSNEYLRYEKFDTISIIITFFSTLFLCLFLKGFIDVPPNTDFSSGGYMPKLYTTDKVKKHTIVFVVVQIIILVGWTISTFIFSRLRTFSPGLMGILVIFSVILIFFTLYLLCYRDVFEEKLFLRCDSCGKFYTLQVDKSLGTNTSKYTSYGQRKEREHVGTIVSGFSKADIYSERNIKTETVTFVSISSYEYKCSCCGEINRRRVREESSTTRDLN